MIKKIITTTTLIAAIAAMANAAETTWTSTTSETTNLNQATSAGFLFNLGSTRLATTANPVGTEIDVLVNLNSINLTWTTSDSGVVTGVGFVLTSTSNTVLAISTTTSDVVKNGNVTIDFSGVDISSSTDYRVWFTDGVLSTTSVGETINVNDILSDRVGIRFANYDTNDEDTGLEVFRYANTITWDKKFAPIVSIKTSAIPEPSMFGLLAGLGALALVGARRRRK